MIIVKTPMRVSLFGGGTDYPEYYREHGGAVLGMAIDKYIWTTVRKLPPFFEHKYRVVYSKVETVKTKVDLEHPAVRAALIYAGGVQEGLEIHHDADLPARSGMGSSSAFMVGLLNALSAHVGCLTDRNALAQTAIDLEQGVMGENVGSQDQVWAAYGGMNRIEFDATGFSVHPVIVTRERRNELLSSIVLYFTGLSRFASEVSAEQARRVARNKMTLHALRQMTDQATQLLAGRGSLRPVGELLTESWRLKRSLSPSITTDAIDEICDAGLRVGAWGCKLLGAGAGGFVAFMCPHDRRPQLRAAMRDLIEINVEVDYDGSKIVLYQPEGL